MSCQVRANALSLVTNEISREEHDAMFDELLVVREKAEAENAAYTDHCRNHNREPARLERLRSI